MKKYFTFLFLSLTLAFTASFKSSVKAQGGWFIGAGVTSAIPGQQIGSNWWSADTAGFSLAQDYTISPKSKTGLYLEFGKNYHIKREQFFNGWEWGIHFKSLHFMETFNYNVLQNDVPIAMNASHERSIYYAGAFVNVYDDIPISPGYIWLRNNLGVNVDYAALGSLKTNGEGRDWGNVNGPQLMAQVHYRIGFPMLLDNGIYIIPSVETPILNVHPWNDFRSTVEFTNFRYRPIIFSIRIQFPPKQEDRECTGIPKQRTKPQLWDKEMRNYKRR